MNFFAFSFALLKKRIKLPLCLKCDSPSIASCRFADLRTTHRLCECSTSDFQNIRVLYSGHTRISATQDLVGALICLSKKTLTTGLRAERIVSRITEKLDFGFILPTALSRQVRGYGSGVATVTQEYTYLQN